MLVPRIASIRRPPAYGGKACASPEGKVQVDEKPCTKDECPSGIGKLSSAMLGLIIEVDLKRFEIDILLAFSPHRKPNTTIVVTYFCLA